MNLLIPPVLADAAANGENAPLDLSGHAASAHAASGGSLVRTIVGLAVVLAVIFGLRWVLKQVKASREEKAQGNGLSSMATLPLGSNRSLHVVRAGKEVLVVGSGEHGVTPVRSYDEAQARALGIIEDEPEPEALKPLAPLPEPGEAGRPRNPLETLRAWTVRG
ncbi:MAG TPA: flagellar biosynthetic protein FliO [Solirubrobacterales bacterium]|nr:flagellar biosynthetic protein FliO [Solirubrobacterales bacterium]